MVVAAVCASPLKKKPSGFNTRIAERFACSLENVRLHLKNVYANGELDRAATSTESLGVRQEGFRRVARRVIYNRDVIISITKFDVGEIAGLKARV